MLLLLGASSTVMLLKELQYIMSGGIHLTIAGSCYSDTSRSFRLFVHEVESRPPF